MFRRGIGESPLPASPRWSTRAEWPYLVMARMENRQGGNLVPVAGEVHHHSS
jgi:hypothetical protein